MTIIFKRENSDEAVYKLTQEWGVSNLELAENAYIGLYVFYTT